jgi:hypothetical protein
MLIWYDEETQYEVVRMRNVERCGDQGRAAAYMARLNLAIIKAAGVRRQGQTGAAGTAPGARLPGSIAGAPVVARVLTRPTASGKAAPVTPLGYKTAVRTMPRILAALGADDPRLRAALILADTMERIGSVPGAGSALEGSATKSGQSDGGATTKVKHAARLKRIEALANGWRITATGRVMRDAPRVALPVGRQTGNLQEIKAYQALVAMCVDGISADEILRRHGWTAKSNTRRKLADALLAALDDVAGGMGYGRWAKDTA